MCASTDFAVGDQEGPAATSTSTDAFAPWAVRRCRLFWICKRLGVIRVPMEQEIAGLDATKYGVLTTNTIPSMNTKSTAHLAPTARAWPANPSFGNTVV